MLGATLASLLPFVGVQTVVANGLLAVDSFALFFKAIFLVAAIFTVLMSVRYLEIEGASPGEYYFLVLCATLGMMIMAGGIDFITSFIGLETMAVSFYILAGFIKPNQRSNEAAVKYFLLGAFSLGILLYGMSILYGLSGTTNLRSMADDLRDARGGCADRAGRSSSWSSGMGFKIAAVPFHMWAPDVYEGAPTPITAFLSVGSKAASFAMLLRIFLEGSAGLRDGLAPALRDSGHCHDDGGQPGGADADQSQADAGLLVDRPRRLPVDRRRGRARRVACRRC